MDLMGCCGNARRHPQGTEMQHRPGRRLGLVAAVLAAMAPASIAVAADLADFQLPPKTVFDRSMPRYPNVWFYVDQSLAATFGDAVKLMTGNLKAAMHAREYHGPFDNPEGCDFEVRIEHLQPWEDPARRAEQHSHAFHMRYYYSALAEKSLESVTVNVGGGERPYYRFGANAHYEVEHTNPNHADVEACPICGRTGEYRDLKGNLVEMVHDPLGLELVLSGTIRGETVYFDNFPEIAVGGIEGLRGKFLVRKYLFEAAAGDRNTLRIGVVVLQP